MENTNKSNLNNLLDDAFDALVLEDDTKLSPKSEESVEIPKEITTGARSGQGDSGVGGTKKQSKGKKSKKQEAGSSKTIDPLKGDFDEEEMNRFFENLTEQLKAEMPKMDPEEAKARITESIPQIFDSIQNLISKDLLYPALKDFSPKFSNWLDKNKPNLNKTDQDRFKKQLDIIDEIIEVFDDESIGTEQKFVKNLELMETMHSLGTFPEELAQSQDMGKCAIM